MKHLYEDNGDAVFSEAHAKELLNVQANYNKMLQELNNKLAKQKSDLAIKYMKIAQQQSALNAVKTAVVKPAATTNAPKQTGTVTTAGQPVNAQGNPKAVESINILRRRDISEDERLRDWSPEEERRTRSTGIMGGIGGRKPVSGTPPPSSSRTSSGITPRRTKRYKPWTNAASEKRSELKWKIEELEQQIQDYNEKFEAPEVSGEVEEFFAEIGDKASDILNSGGYKDDKEILTALKEVGVEDPKGVLQNYYYYYPAFNPALDKERKEADKEIPKIQAKIDKLQAKFDKMEEMYESANVFDDKSDYEVWLEEVYYSIATNLDWDVDKEYTYEAFDTYGEELRDIYEDTQDVDEAAALIISVTTEKDDEMYESVNESSYDLFNVSAEDLLATKHYMDAEDISYIEDEDGNTIDFDEDEFDEEMREALPEMGFKKKEVYSETDDILSVSDDEEDEDIEEDPDGEKDVTDIDQKIDEEKVFYVKIDDEGSEFIGKIYKLFDEGDWRAKLMKGESETFEQLNYDPNYDEFDIISFLRENYDDAELLSEDEYNKYIDDSKDVIEESLHYIPTLDEYTRKFDK